MTTLKEYIEGADLDDDSTFTAVVQRATNELKIDARALASLMRVSVPTAARWINGVTMPHVAVRSAVRRGLLKKLAEAS